MKPNLLSPCLLAALFAACGGSGGGCGGPYVLDTASPPASDLAPIELAHPLAASFADPLLLTVAAARARSSYLVDEGYTLTRDDDGVIAFATDTGGDVGVIFEVDGKRLVAEPDFATPWIIQHTASDAIVLTADLTTDLAVELRFVVASSAVALTSVRIENQGDHQHSVGVTGFVRRCAGGLTAVKFGDSGIFGQRYVRADPQTVAAAPDSIVEDFVDGFVADGGEVFLSAIARCGDTAAGDLRTLDLLAPPAGDDAQLVTLRAELSLDPGAADAVRFYRAVATDTAGVEATLTAVRPLALAPIVTAGEARLAASPCDPAAPDYLVCRSAFTLLDELAMPAEGRLDHDYYVFSREPTWWFGRLGQHVHESLSMIAAARQDPALAMSSMRVFLDRVAADGYLPYNIGPYAEQTIGHTASAPLLSYDDWMIYQQTKDAGFLAEAYAAGVKVHDFWQTQRDVDQDGLAEWAGFLTIESPRDLNVAVWQEVAPPQKVEAIDLNCMLVMEEKSLALMADALGKPSEAQALRDAAAARAQRINDVMWDEQTGFYYNVETVSESFTVKAPRDLIRPEVAGFLPLWAGIVPADRLPRLLAHLDAPSEFGRAFGVPSLSAADPSYAAGATACCEWSGPSWVPWDFLILRGLLDAGEIARARTLVAHTMAAVRAQLTRTHQFREHYDPDDQDLPNQSMPNYIWSALVAEMALELP